MTRTHEELIKVGEQLEQVRQSGKANMYMVNDVQVVANQMNLYAVVVYVEDNRRCWWTALEEAMDAFREAEEKEAQNRN